VSVSAMQWGNLSFFVCARSGIINWWRWSATTPNFSSQWLTVIGDGGRAET